MGETTMIELKKVLVVVADSAEAKVYIAHGPRELTQIEHLLHDESRLSNSELTTKAHDVNTCPYEAQDSMKQHEKLTFAKKVARSLEKTLETKNLAELCIFAAPQFLGELNKNLTKNHVNITAINKDMLYADNARILQDMQDAGVTFLPT